jgi:hypothetical protein
MARQNTVTNWSNSISTVYPVAGQDNDTQGFRDNFTNIKNAFTNASKQFSDINNNAVFIDQTNNLSGNILQNATLQSFGQLVIDKTLVPASGSQTVDFTEGNYQKWALSSSTNFTVINWPASKIHATVRLELHNTSATNITVSVLTGTNTLLLDAMSSTAFPATLNTTTTYIYDIASADGGVTQLAKLSGRYN